MNRTIIVIITLVMFLIPFAAQAQDTGKRRALVIAGLSGSPEYRDQYRSWLAETRRALAGRCRFSDEDITVLAEASTEQDTGIDGISSAEAIRAAFERLSSNATEKDDVYIILFGHGSYDGRNAMLNIPQVDLKDADYAGLIDTVRARRIVFINTASCSAPFIDHISAPDRIVITATGSGTERNETVFPRFLVEGLAGESSDLDKNGDLTVSELFQYAAENTARFYKENEHLETEHPLLEDTGDRRGFRAGELAKNNEGGLAQVTTLTDRAMLLAGSPGPVNEQVTFLLGEQETVLRDITALKAAKAKYKEEEYYLNLEPLFIRLARISDEIESYRQ